jgi:outer membrane protein
MLFFLNKKLSSILSAFLLFFALSCFLVAKPVFAAASVAVFDAERAIKESLAIKDVQNKIAKKQDEYQKEVNKKQTELEAEQKKIETKKTILSKDKFEKEVQDFEKKVEDFKNGVDKKQNALRKASIDAVGTVNEVLKKVVADLAKEKSIDIVVNGSQLVFFNAQTDISDEVIVKLNKLISKVEVKFE